MTGASGYGFLVGERSSLRSAPFWAFAAYAPSLRSVRYSTTRHSAHLRSLTVPLTRKTPSERSTQRLRRR